MEGLSGDRNEEGESEQTNEGGCDVGCRLVTAAADVIWKRQKATSPAGVN